MCVQAFKPKAATTPLVSPGQASPMSSPGSTQSSPRGRTLQYTLPYHSWAIPPCSGEACAPSGLPGQSAGLGHACVQPGRSMSAGLQAAPGCLACPGS